MNKNQQRGESISTILVVVFLIIFAILGLMFGLPVYNVWQQRLSGEAALAKAEQTRQIIVKQAQAEKDSAHLRAEAIGIVGQAAKDFPEYRQQEFIGAFAEAMHNGKISQIIYVPTEANIPVMEAGHRPAIVAHPADK